MTTNLILYYSRRGENYVNGHIENLKKGNTEICAEFIKNAVGGDLFEIQTITNYSKDYHQCTKEAAQEIKDNARPKLTRYLDNISDYKNVFICGPCWWGTFPMAVFSQLEKLDFTGKKVMALMTHEGSGLGNSEHDLKKICQGASFGNGIAIHGADSWKAEEAISKWAKNNIK